MSKCQRWDSEEKKKESKNMGGWKYKPMGSFKNDSTVSVTYFEKVKKKTLALLCWGILVVHYGFTFSFRADIQTVIQA